MATEINNYNADTSVGRRGPGTRRILNKEGSVIGYLNGRYIYDLDWRLWGILPSRRISATYVEPGGSGAAIALGYLDVNGNLFDARSNYVGTIERKRRIVIVVPIVCLLLLLVGLSSYYSSYILGSVGVNVYNPTYPVIQVVQEQDDLTWTQIERMDMLNTQAGKQVIYPGSSGEYNFILENDSESKLSFDVSVIDDNPNYIPMRFRLKMMNTYIAGGEFEWVTIKDLQFTNLDMRNSARTLFTLEWMWDTNVSDVHDTGIGNTESLYNEDAVAYYIQVIITATVKSST